MSNASLAKAPQETTVLVTGGAGFIGSHTVVELLERGYNVVVLDDFSNSSPKALDRVREICSLDATDPQLSLIEGSILDRDTVEEAFTRFNIDTIIHFAGFKAVGESVEKPLEYYWNNIAGTLVLADVARAHGCKNIVFSSSATVYGETGKVPFEETDKRESPTNPYGQTKAMLEQILTDLYVSDDEWNVVLLRYFNPIGAHPSGLIGEDPQGIPNNLLPYVAQVAIGTLDEVGVFGDDYPTQDGTGVRDYIHVVDLARGHVAALEWMAAHPSGVEIFNLGTGRGSSVLDVIHSFEKACGHAVLYKIKPRRAGDIAECFASCDKARDELGWVAEYDLDRMCEDSWRWQSMNPRGYDD